MRTVKVKTRELLEKVKANRTKHVAEYQEAVEGYKEAAMNEVRKGMERLENQISILKAGEMIRLASVSFQLPVPEDHSKDYDQVIAMLEMCVDLEIEVKADEFACYVMDDWGWKAGVTEVFNTYNKKTL